MRTFLTSKRFGASVGALTSVISASDGVEWERPVSFQVKRNSTRKKSDSPAILLDDVETSEPKVSEPKSGADDGQGFANLSTLRLNSQAELY